MPIFDMYGGRPDLYTADETDRLNNPEKYNYTQAQYDALVARIESRVKSRQAVDQRGREAVLTSYANFGTGGTNPGFSLAGRSGHTSGGLAGNAGTAEYAGTAQYAEGGRVEQEGIGLLFERANTPAPMDPILEHHYRNLAEGKAVNNDDGSVSTVYTTQVDIDGTPTLIPKIWDGQVLSDEAALQRSLASGKTWPTAATHEDLRQYDIELHKEMAPMTAEAAQKVLAGGDDSQQYAEGGMVEGLGEYIAKLSPDAQETLTNATKEMSPQQQLEFLASLQMMDGEFQIAVAPYMPEGSTIDPSIARLKTFPKEAGIGPEGLTLQGVSSKGVTSPKQLTENFEGYELELEPDTVSAIEAANANPAVFAHEYRHFEGSDGGGEGVNRLQDLMASQNSAELGKNARMVIDQLYSKARNDADKEKYRDMYYSTVNSTEEETIKTVQELLDDRNVANALRWSEDVFEKAAKSPYFNKITGANESIIDTLRGYLPDGYAEGGMVQNVQYMQLGGMASPYADPISKPQMMGQQTLAPMGGVGGLFQDMNRNQMEQNRNQMGMMQAQMGGAPLEVYGNYLNNVYTAPQAESSQAQVAEFIDMVDRAERAHFGAEESFGYGGGAYQQGLMSQYQNLPAPTNMMDNQQYRGGPSGLEQSAGFSQLPQMSSGLPQVY